LQGPVVQSDFYLGYDDRKWKVDWAGRGKTEVSNNKNLKKKEKKER
jgi:hypothetical protein